MGLALTATLETPSGIPKQFDNKDLNLSCPSGGWSFTLHMQYSFTGMFVTLVCLNFFAVAWTSSLFSLPRKACRCCDTVAATMPGSYQFNGWEPCCYWIGVHQHESSRLCWWCCSSLWPRQKRGNSKSCYEMHQLFLAHDKTHLTVTVFFEPHVPSFNVCALPKRPD